MATSTLIVDPQPRAPSTSARLGLRTAIVWGIILLSPLPQLLVHFRRLWGYDHYSYFPFVIAAFGYFAWRRWPTSDRSSRERMPNTERALLSIGFVLLAVSTVVWSPWLAAVATIITIGAALLHFAGRPAMTQLLSAWLLLWLLIPIPFGLDGQLIFKLQTVASNGASYLLDFLGVNHLLAGHVLEVPRHQFMVEEACSGIHSLFALLAFAAILLIALRRSWIHSAILLTTAVFWATSINIIRVTTVVVAFVWFDIDLATPWKHEALGLALNGFAILMLACTDQLILFFLERPDHFADDKLFLDEEDEEDDSLHPSEPKYESDPVQTRPDVKHLERSSQLRGSTIAAVLFAVLGIGQAATLGLKVDAWRVAGEASEGLDGAFQASTLPEQIGTWKQVGFETESRGLTSNLGAKSAAWRYQTEGATVVVHTNFPFQGWHELPACFEAQGWQIQSLDVTPVAARSGAAIEIWRLELSQPSAVMHVRFCQFDAYGEPVRPTTRWWPAWWHKLLYSHAGTPWRFLASNTATYQVVLQVTPGQESTDVSPEELTTNFLTAQNRIAETILKRLRADDRSS